jgi:hypothetical protein
MGHRHAYERIPGHLLRYCPRVVPESHWDLARDVVSVAVVSNGVPINESAK